MGREWRGGRALPRALTADQVANACVMLDNAEVWAGCDFYDPSDLKWVKVFGGQNAWIRRTDAPSDGRVDIDGRLMIVVQHRDGDIWRLKRRGSLPILGRPESGWGVDKRLGHVGNDGADDLPMTRDRRRGLRALLKKIDWLDNG